MRRPKGMYRSSFGQGQVRSSTTKGHVSYSARAGGEHGEGPLRQPKGSTDAGVQPKGMYYTDPGKPPLDFTKRFITQVWDLSDELPTQRPPQHFREVLGHHVGVKGRAAFPKDG